MQTREGFHFNKWNQVWVCVYCMPQKCTSPCPHVICHISHSQLNSSCSLIKWGHSYCAALPIFYYVRTSLNLGSWRACSRTIILFGAFWLVLDCCIYRVAIKARQNLSWLFCKDTHKLHECNFWNMYLSCQGVSNLLCLEKGERIALTYVKKYGYFMLYRSKT